MHGRIVKGVGGNYQVRCDNGIDYTCKAKGIFRYQKKKLLIGDYVEIEVLDEETKSANLYKIDDRKSELIRPAIANADQAVIEFAAKDPEPNLNLLDRFLLLMEEQELPVIICFNKVDLVPKEKIEAIADIYRKIGYPVLLISAKENIGIDQLKNHLDQKTTVWAGPSGVGKSSLINLFCPEMEMETGEISQKIKRGKHTTRHSQLLRLYDETYVCDTPGFSSIFVEGIASDKLHYYFPEFEKYEPGCRFNGCIHIGERDCAVKDAVKSGEIAESRYENYKLIYAELKNKEKY